MPPQYPTLRYINPFSATSLGNVDVLRHSAAVVEFVLSGVLVYFLFWSRYFLLYYYILYKIYDSKVLLLYRGG